MIIDGFKFNTVRPGDIADKFIGTYAVTIFLNGAEVSTEYVSSMRELAKRICDLDEVLLPGDEIRLKIQVYWRF